MQTSFISIQVDEAKHLVVFSLEGSQYLPGATALDSKFGGLIKKADAADRFSGKKGEVLAVTAPVDAPQERIWLVGLGPSDKLDEETLMEIGGKITVALNGAGIAAADVLVEAPQGVAIPESKMATALAMGANMRAWRFDKYLTKEKEEDKPSLQELRFMLGGVQEATLAFEPLREVLAGINLTREVVSEPANIIYPESLADVCRELRDVGVEVEVYGEKQLKKMGAGALLGVGQGSIRESQMVVMRWNGAEDKKAAPVAFVGKGVTFDTGGISIKPSGGMEEMKWDMGGAGTVIGLVRALAGRKAKANIIGAVGLVENMPDGNAQRPGDIVTSMSGQTIEVLNTDAEGRLVLADVLWHVQQEYKPQCMIDLATLTGAVIICLGHHMAGLFSNNDELAGWLLETGEKTGEKLWRLPLAPYYDKKLDSPVADMQNIAEGREAGSTMAAQFLQRFVGDTVWAHLDIAATAWSKKDSDLMAKGSTAFGVRLLDRLVREHYEQ